MSDFLPPTQADRDFAARWCGYSIENRDRIRTGKLDNSPVVQAIAQRRVESVRLQNIEEAAQCLVDTAYANGAWSLDSEIEALNYALKQVAA